MFKLNLVNVGALGSMEIELESGLTAVLGPNGVGKSTLVNAFFFALTGETLDGASLEDMITWGHPHMIVTLTGDCFQVQRTVRREGTTKQVLTADGVDLHKKTEINDWILAHYGLSDSSVFRSVYFAEQFKAISIIEATNSQRLEMLSNVFGLNKFEKCRAVLQQTISSLNVASISDDMMQQLQANVESSDTALLESQANLDFCRQNILSEEEQQRLTQVTQSITIERLEQVQQELATTEQSLQSLESQLQSLPQDVERPDYDGYQQKLRYDALLPEYERAKAAYDTLQSNRETSVANVEKLINEMQQKLGALQSRRAEIEGRRSKLENGKCPITGGQPCPDLLSMTNVATIQQELFDVDAKIKTLETNLEQAQQMKQRSLVYERELLTATTELQQITGQLAAVKPYADFDIVLFQQQDQRFQQHQQIAKQREALIQQKLPLMAQKQTLSAIVENASKNPAVPMIEQEAASATLQKHSVAVHNLPVYQNAVTTAIQTKKAATDALEAAQRQNEEALRVQRCKDLLMKTRHVMHRDNAPRLLLDTVRKELNQRTAQYVEAFEFPYTPVWYPDGSFVYNATLQEGISVKRLSGGQKYVLTIISRCVFADILRSTFPILALDEPTTGLDKPNREILSGMLQNISDILGKKGMTLLIPSHDDVIVSAATRLIEL